MPLDNRIQEILCKFSWIIGYCNGLSPHDVYCYECGQSIPSGIETYMDDIKKEAQEGLELCKELNNAKVLKD